MHSVVFSALLVALLSSSLLGTALGACTAHPTVTEGPYYSNTGLVRQNITEGKSGFEFKLLVQILNASDCQPLLQDTHVDLWHCDALGLYSAFTNNQNPAPVGSTFLRGIQPVNGSGWAEFHTIFPGWYVGRDTHIHFKVRLGGSQGTVIFTGQLFVDDTTSDEINSLAPYSSNTGGERTLLEEDNIYVGFGLIQLTKMNEAAGWAGGLVGNVVVPVSVGSQISTPSQSKTPTNASPSISTQGLGSSPALPSSSPSSSANTASSSSSSASTITAIPFVVLIFFCVGLWSFLVL